jgi:hypothetical protein
MYYITYQFNESAIITVTAISFSIFKPIPGETDDIMQLTDRQGTTHRLPATSLISIVPVRKVRQRATTPKKD